MNDIQVELDRAYLVGVLRGVHTCKKIYETMGPECELNKELDKLMSLVEADLAMSQPHQNIARA